MGLIEHVNIPNHLWDNIYQTGSSVICSPPVLDTDIDYVIYSRYPSKIVKWLVENKYEESFGASDEDYDMLVDGTVDSVLRKDNINLIVVSDYDFYLLWVRATGLAKQFNLLKKQDRIDLFQAILYPDGEF